MARLLKLLYNTFGLINVEGTDDSIRSPNAHHHHDLVYLARRHVNDDVTLAKAPLVETTRNLERLRFKVLERPLLPGQPVLLHDTRNSMES